MCGVVGIVSVDPVNQTLFDLLSVLQHRGQDAAGIATLDGNHLCLHKGNGLVRDVFRTRHMESLKGNLGIGHVRYPTQGSLCESQAQPFYVNSPYGIALVHNGNLTNTDMLKTELFRDDLRHINTLSDSEVILNVFAHELQRIAVSNTNLGADPQDCFQALTSVYQRCRGAYAVIVLIVGLGIIGFRDPNGIRPLIYGKRQCQNKQDKIEYMIASESVALTSQGFEVIADVAPGQAVLITQKGELYTKQCVPQQTLSPCLFEYVYFARPDSMIDKISVYKLRKNIGAKVAEKIQKCWLNHDIDVVIPIPETSRSSALSLATALNIKYREGFVKNRYIGRTFIMSGQAQRKKSVSQKLSTIDLEFKDRNVLLVDDSIVRGTTSYQIIEMARKAGAKKVYFASCSPPIRYPNIYGIDMPSAKELIAHNRSVEEIQNLIAADKLIYVDLEDLVSVARQGNPEIVKFESSVFDGEYVTGTESRYLSRVALSRCEEV